ncbi:MAG: transporter [Nitrospiria bacterium]
MIILSALLSLFSPLAVTFAQRPFLLTESAVPVEKGSYRFEAGFTRHRFGSGIRGTTLTVSLRYGLIQNLEIDLEVPYLFFKKRGGNTEDQFGDILLKTKVRFLKGRVANPLSIAGILEIKFPSADREPNFRPETTGEADVGLWGIASKEFMQATAHINFGYILVGNPAFGNKPDQIRYAIGLENELWEGSTTLFGELSGTNDVGSDAPSNDTLVVVGGFSYHADLDLDLDASAGFGLTDDSADYVISAGLTYFLN